MRVEKDSVRVGIHSAPNHADDILCVALVKRFHKDVEVVRTRDEEILKTCDYVLDVGGVNERIEKDANGVKRIICDHHAIDSGYEENGVKKAACSRLVDILYSDDDFVRKELHHTLIDPVAAEDNGQTLDNISRNLLNFVGVIEEPDWVSYTKEDADKCFNEALAMTEKVLDKVLQNISNKQYGYQLVEKEFEKGLSYLVFDRYIPRSIWQYYLTKKDKAKRVKCVAFKANSGVWDVIMTKKQHGSYDTNISFPKKWCGLRNKELEEASGIKGAIFCHSAGFFWESETKESALAVIEKVLNL